MNSSYTAVRCRVIILIPRRHLDDLTLDICRYRDKTVGRVPVIDQFVEGTDTCNVERRRPGESGTCRGLGFGHHVKAGLGPKEVDEFRKQFETGFVLKRCDLADGGLDSSFLINGFEDDAIVFPSLDAAACH